MSAYKDSIHMMLADLAAEATAALQLDASNQRADVGYPLLTIADADSPLPLSPMGGAWLDGQCIRWADLPPTDGLVTIGGLPLDAIRTQDVSWVASSAETRGAWLRGPQVQASTHALLLLGGTAAAQGVWLMDAVVAGSRFVPNRLHAAAVAWRVAAGTVAIELWPGVYEWWLPSVVTSLSITTCGAVALERRDLQWGMSPGRTQDTTMAFTLDGWQVAKGVAFGATQLSAGAHQPQAADACAKETAATQMRRLAWAL